MVSLVDSGLVLLEPVKGSEPNAWLKPWVAWCPLQVVCLTPCFKFLAIVFSFFYYSKFWSINHNKNESLNLPQLN